MEAGERAGCRDHVWVSSFGNCLNVLLVSSSVRRLKRWVSNAQSVMLKCQVQIDGVVSALSKAESSWSPAWLQMEGSCCSCWYRLDIQENGECLMQRSWINRSGGYESRRPGLAQRFAMSEVSCLFFILQLVNNGFVFCIQLLRSSHEL